MEKQIKKKTKIRLLPFLITLIVVVIILVLGKIVINLPIRNIYIKGNVYLSDQEIIEIAGIEEYPSFIMSFSHNLKKELKNDPWIINAKVEKKFWGIILITVEEAEPLFEVLEEEKIVLSDGSKVEKELLDTPVAGLLNIVPTKKYKKFIKEMADIDISVRYLISEITYVPNEQDKDRFLLYMTDGNYVYLTLTKFQHINYYKEVLEQLEGKKGILYLDSGNHFQIMEEEPVID